MARQTYAEAVARGTLAEALAPLVTAVNPDGTAFTLPTTPVAAVLTAVVPAATVGTSSAQALAASASAVERVFTNDSATATIYLAPGTAAAVVGQGVRLNAAGGQWRTTTWTGAVQAIASGPASPLAITEIRA